MVELSPDSVMNPAAAPKKENALDGFLAFVKDYGVQILLVILVLVIVWAIILRIRSKDKKIQTLQRDGMEVTRRDRIASCKLNRDKRIKTLKVTGNEITRGKERVGHYVGHEDHHELWWVAFRPGFFGGLGIGRIEVGAFPPVCLEGTLGAPELVLRGRGFHRVRDLWFLNVNVHSPKERQIWAQRLGWVAHNPTDFTEKVKAYYRAGVRNDVNVMESLNAIEDIEHVRKEVMRTNRELTQTAKVPVAPKPVEEAKPVEGVSTNAG